MTHKPSKIREQDELDRVAMSKEELERERRSADRNPDFFRGKGSNHVGNDKHRD